MFDYNHFILKMPIKVGMHKLFSHIFHVVTCLLGDYGAIQLSLGNCTLQLTSCHNPPNAQIPNTPSSILINLFKSIKFLLFINIELFGCRYNKTLLWQLHIERKSNDLQWFHFCEYFLIMFYYINKPMAHFLYVMPIFYFS